MKKIFILPMLIAPIMANATDPVGPSAVVQGGTPVVATASAPYATAGAETGDTTNVVSASYVKGAYNDAIAAVNKVNADKQGKLLNSETDEEVASVVMSKDYLGTPGVLTGDDDEFEAWYDDIDQDFEGIDNTLMSSAGVISLVRTAANQVKDYNNSKRVSAVTTWGDDTHPTKLQLTNQ